MPAGLRGVVMGEDRPTVADGASASMSSNTMSGLIGRVFNGRYRVEQPIGSGSMGDVYEGLSVVDGRTIAIKVLKPEHAGSELFRHRFLREAKSTVMINHPNVVDIIDFGEAEGGWLYIVMEYLEGEDLSGYLRRLGRLTWRQSCALLQQIASGLSAAHDAGVVHRDIKPSNILLIDNASGGARVKIVDFGVAKVDGPMVSRVLTAVDDVIGTVAYMSPEQAEGREADLRSDIYALGVTAYELATGHVPFQGRDMFQVMVGHLETPPIPPCVEVPDFPIAANAFILRCLAKPPLGRYQSMGEVLQVLRTTASPDAVSLPPPVATRVTWAPTAEQPNAGGPRHEAFEEAPTGYFFRPVPTPVPPRAAQPPTPADVPPRPIPKIAMPGVPIAATPSLPLGPPPSGLPVPAFGHGPPHGSAHHSGGYPGGTIRVPKIERPIVDDQFDVPAGQMSTPTIVAILSFIIACVATLTYFVAIA